MSIVNTVGQTKKFAGATKIYSNSNLTGTQYDYKANTSVKILENVSSNIDTPCEPYVFPTYSLYYL